MAQTTWTERANAFAGTIADLGPSYVRSYTNEEAVALPFGVGVVQGSADNGALLPDTVADMVNFLGVTVHTHALDNQGLSDEDGIPVDETMNVMMHGVIYVAVEAAVSAMDDVYCRVTASASEQEGAFRNSSDSGDAVRVPGAKFLEAGSGAGSIVPVFFPPFRKLDDNGFQITNANASLTADTTDIVGISDATRSMVVTGASYYNATGLAEDATNFFDIQFDAGGTTVANWSTETGEEGTIAAATVVSLTLAAAADLVIAPGTVLSVIYDKDGTATLPAGVLTVHGYYI